MVTVTIITDSNDNYGTTNGFKETQTDDDANNFVIIIVSIVNGKW